MNESDQHPPEISDAVTDELTRRQWLLRLGEMVVLAGFSGLAPEPFTHLLSAEEASTGLPPGLYAPSADHLVHALRSGHKLVARPPGSETDYAGPVASPFQPQFFSAEEFPTVTQFVEVILGKMEPDSLSQTTQWLDLWLHSSAGVREAAQHLDPLHRALAVAYFGEASVHDLESADPAAIARQGLAALHEVSVQKYGLGFSELTAEQRTKLVYSISTVEADSPLRKFLETVRGGAIRGYYTSAAGLEELDYKGNSYYPECPGCKSGPRTSELGLQAKTQRGI